MYEIEIETLCVLDALGNTLLQRLIHTGIPLPFSVLWKLLWACFPVLDDISIALYECMAGPNQMLCVGRVRAPAPWIRHRCDLALWTHTSAVTLVLKTILQC